jgi:hypothetical protein
MPPPKDAGSQASRSLTTIGKTLPASRCPLKTERDHKPEMVSLHDADASGVQLRCRWVLGARGQPAYWAASESGAAQGAASPTLRQAQGRRTRRHAAS